MSPRTNYCFFRDRTEDRLLRLIDIGEPTDCWEWLGATGSNGYGRFKLDGKLVLPHRLVYEKAYGPIERGDLRGRIVIMHTCDNRRCSNPHHLRLGNQSMNVRDMVQKGRGRKPRALAHA